MAPIPALRAELPSVGPQVECRNERGLEPLWQGLLFPHRLSVKPPLSVFSFQNPQPPGEGRGADHHPKRNCEDESGHSFLRTHPVCLGSEAANAHFKTLSYSHPRADPHPALPGRAPGHAAQHPLCHFPSALPLPQNRLPWPLGSTSHSQESHDNWFPTLHTSGRTGGCCLP